jgi:hypothetical protein
MNRSTKIKHNTYIYTNRISTFAALPKLLTFFKIIPLNSEYICSLELALSYKVELSSPDFGNCE